MKNKNTLLNIFAYFMIFIFMACSAFAYASPAAVDLGKAGDFIILSYAGITDVPTSTITGNIGVSPLPGSTIGVPCGELTGNMYAVDATGPACAIIDASLLTTAMTNLGTAYTDANSRPTDVLNAGDGAGEIGGLTLTTGVYTFTGASINVLISTDLTLSGNSNDVWIFQIPGTFNVAAGKKVNLIGGAQAKNIFWAVAGATTIHGSAVVNGNILDHTSIAMQNLATLNGRALAETEAVTLDANTILIPDLISPVITIIGTNPVNVTENTNYTDEGATALDDVDGNLNASIIVINNVNTSLVGDYNVNYSVSDAAGNLATATRTVSVITSSLPCVDADGDNYTSSVCGGLDCNDANVSINPDMSELKNSIDDNCNGYIDEGFTNGTLAQNETMSFECGASKTVCTEGAFTCEHFVTNSTGSLICDHHSNVTVIMQNNGQTYLEFDWDSDKYTLDFKDINSTEDSFENRSYSIINGVEGYMHAGATKTLYLNRSADMNGVCIKDAVISDITQITPLCNATDEVHLMCDSSLVNGYSCSSIDSNTRYKITGLTHSGIIQQNVVVQSAVNLGTSGNFVILAKSGVSTTGTTSVTGDIGISPAAATFITGFGLIMDSSNQFATSSLVTGKIYAVDYAVPTPTTMTTAVSDMETAYTDAAGRTNPTATEIGAGNIGGMTLTPGLYKWGTGVTIPTDMTLSGNSSDVWVFQIAQTLDISNGKKIILSGGAQAKNIFWQVAGQTTLGTTSVFNGIILGKTAIVMSTGATLNGRALAQTAVTLDATQVSLPVIVESTPASPSGGGGGGGGSWQSDSEVTKATDTTPAVYPNCDTNSECKSGESCKYASGEYYKQCVPIKPTIKLLDKTQKNTNTITTGPIVTTKTPGLTAITGNAIVNTLKSTAGKGIIAGIGILAFGILAYLTFFRKK